VHEQGAEKRGGEEKWKREDEPGEKRDLTRHGRWPSGVGVLSMRTTKKALSQNKKERGKRKRQGEGGKSSNAYRATERDVYLRFRYNRTMQQFEQKGVWAP